MNYSPTPELTSQLHIFAFASTLHSVSLHLFQAGILIKLQTKLHLNVQDIKYMASMFDVTQYVFYLIGGIIQEISFNKFVSILVLIAICIMGQILFNLSKAIFLMKVSIVLVAATSSTIKIGLIAYGAVENYTKSCIDLYQYFLVIYLSEFVGYLIAILLMPPTMILQNKCGLVDCLAFILWTSIVFEFVAALVFSLCNTNTTVNQAKRDILSEFPKVYRFLTMFIPFLVILVCYENIIRRLIPLAKLLNCHIFIYWYSFNTDNMLSVYLMIIIISGIIYYCLTCFKFKIIIFKPIYTIGFGGFLMMIGVMLSSHLNYIADKYDLAIPPANQANLYFVTECNKPVFKMNNLTIKYKDVNKKSFHQVYYELNSKNGCSLASAESYLIDFPMFSNKIHRNICFVEKRSYIVNLKCLKIPVIPENEDTVVPKFYLNFTVHAFDRSRDPNGHPKLCFIATNGQWSKNYRIVVASVNQIEIQYKFMINDNFTCRIIKEGLYNIFDKHEIKDKNVFFQSGGVYWLKYSSNGGFKIAEIQKPPGITIWYLILVLTMIEFGKLVMVVSGFYLAYTQTEANIRTIAIGNWCVYITSGTFISMISGEIAITYKHMNKMLFSGFVIGLMTVLLIITTAVCGQWNFLCDQAHSPPLTPTEKLPSSPLPTTQQPASTSSATKPISTSTIIRSRKKSLSVKIS